MAAATAPIFPNVPVITWGNVATANTALDGTGTVVTVHTAGTNGSRVGQLRIASLGTNIATVVRVFVNNGLTNTTAANNSLIKEVTYLGATLSQTSAQSDIVVPLNIALPTGYKLNVTVGTTIAAGIQVTCEGGNY